MLVVVLFCALLFCHTGLSKSIQNVTDYDTDLSSLKLDVEILKQQVKNMTDIKGSQTIPGVFFFVKLSSGVTLNKNSIVKWDTVVTDMGNNFNPGDGIFVAPVAGYYQFSWTIFTYPNKALDTELRVDNVVIDSMYGYSTPGGSVAETKIVICKIKIGDHIWIQSSLHYTDNSIYTLLDSRSSFMGLLIMLT